MEGPLCIILPPGLQYILMATGLVRALSDTHELLIATQLEHLEALRRVLGDLSGVRFWFDDPDPVTNARKRGMHPLVLPPDPKGMYSAAGVPIAHMHQSFKFKRDDVTERAMVDHIIDTHGPTFVATWSSAPGGRMCPKFFPQGIPIVDLHTLPLEMPLDVAAVLERATQVHAVDSWMLTLADLLGAQRSKLYCHAYTGGLSAYACRRKYRRRVAMVCRART